MSVKKGKRGIIPNWIKENNWSFEQRIKFAGEIMVFSPRDWSVNDYAVGGEPDAEKWALWCLVNCDTKKEALETWFNFCDGNQLSKIISPNLYGIYKGGQILKDYENNKKCTESSCDYYNCMMELNCSYSEDNSKCVKTADPLSSHAMLGEVIADIKKESSAGNEDFIRIRTETLKEILGNYFA